MGGLDRGAATPSGSDASDRDPEETRDWIESLDAVSRVDDAARALFLLRQLDEHAKELGLVAAAAPFSAYRNTIPLERQGIYPGDLAIEDRITAIMRWNALAMVVRANQAYGELGGHIASYASAAEIFEIGFNHFFRGPDAEQGGDLVYFQPHSAPGVFRSELGGHIASYASAAEIFEIGFNHFFRGPDAEQGGDLVYFQPHSAPGVY